MFLNRLIIALLFVYEVLGLPIGVGHTDSKDSVILFKSQLTIIQVTISSEANHSLSGEFSSSIHSSFAKTPQDVVVQDQQKVLSRADTFSTDQCLNFEGQEASSVSLSRQNHKVHCDIKVFEDENCLRLAKDLSTVSVRGNDIQQLNMIMGNLKFKSLKANCLTTRRLPPGKLIWE